MSNKPSQPLFFQNEVTTKNDLLNLKLALKLFKQIVFKNEEKFPTPSELSQLTFGQFSALSQLWEDYKQEHHAATLSAFIGTLTGQIEEALNQVVTLTIPYQPTLEQVAELTTQVRQHLSPLAILDITYQPDIVAGFTLAASGKQVDWSLREWLPHYVQHAQSPT